MDMKKHYGYLENTGTRVVVVFRFLPADPTNALVVALDSLPDGWRDEVLNAVNSQAGQKTVDFYTALQNRNFSDGTNVLNGLHNYGLLKKVPVSQVMMTPITGQKVPLAMINASVSNTLDQYIADEASKIETVAPVIEKEIDPVILANGLLAQADVLEKQASELVLQSTAKRNEAYALAPSLKPVLNAGRPPLNETEKAANLLDRKQKRLERDRANAAKAKVEKTEQALLEKINNKVVRDSKRTAPIEKKEDDISV